MNHNRIKQINKYKLTLLMVIFGFLRTVKPAAILKVIKSNDKDFKR